MKNLTCCVLSAILLSSMPAFALTIVPPVSEAQKIRESYRLFISSKKVALERLEKYGFMDIKNSGKYECFMDDEVFSCIVIHPYGFVMKGDVFTKSIIASVQDFHLPNQYLPPYPKMRKMNSLMS